MGKRSSTKLSSQLEGYHYEIHSYNDSNEEPVETQDAGIQTVKIQLQKDVKLTCTGNVTGNTYVFNGAGAIVDVDQRDVEVLLLKGNKKPSCCGSYGSPYFRLYEV